MFVCFSLRLIFFSFHRSSFPTFPQKSFCPLSFPPFVITCIEGRVLFQSAPTHNVTRNVVIVHGAALQMSQSLPLPPGVAGCQPFLLDRKQKQFGLSKRNEKRLTRTRLIAIMADCDGFLKAEGEGTVFKRWRNTSCGKRDKTELRK